MAIAPYTVLYYVCSMYQHMWHSDQLESNSATLDSSQEALLQVMSVNQINTVKPAQWYVFEDAEHKKN